MNARHSEVSVYLGVILLLVVSQVAMATAEDQVELPIERIVLFNSGIGYFEHLGDVSGDQQVDLRFTVENVNDLLKSMVLQDMAGGSVSAVTYGLKTPVDQQLTDFSIDLRDAPTMGEMLQQLRGERVRVEGASKGTGSIVGLEVQVENVDGKTVSSEFLNLHTSEGLKSIPLRSVSKIQLLDEQLNDELGRALAALAESRQSNRRTVTVRFTGEGKRAVRIAYILPTPVWKAAYRLVLEDGDSALMQGWAVVENMSDFDWTGVAVSLVSGRPISFAIDLYSPLFVQRQQLPVEVAGLPASRIYDDVDRRRRPSSSERGGAAFGGGFGGGGGLGGFGAPGTTAADEAQGELDPSQGVSAQAVGKEVGEYFRYDIRKPVTLSAGRSAMLPIVNEKVETEKLSIYTAAAGQSHALHALRLKNSTEVYLMGGPITVFEAGSYAGDARIRDLPPGADRLISYAVDQGTKVAREVEIVEPKIASAELKSGVLHIQRDHARQYRYSVDYKGTQQRKLMIEHPRPDRQWRVAQPKATEETASHLRFVVHLAPRGAKDTTIVEQLRTSEEVKLTDLQTPAISEMISLSVVDDETRNSLKEYLRLKQSEKQLTQRLSSLRSQVTTIQADQTRIRSNMEGLDRTSSLYERYVAKMDEQENTLDELVKETLSLSQRIEEVSRSLADISGI